MSDDDVVTMAPKGVALLAAVKTGIVPKTKKGYDVEIFEKFWGFFEKGLDVYGYEFKRKEKK